MRTSVNLMRPGHRRPWQVLVIGTRGAAILWRRTLEEARASARNYAVILDAPHEVI